MRVAMVKVKNYAPDAVTLGIHQSLGLLGGIGCFIQPGERVLLKPNMLEGLPCESAVTTHPEVVRAMIRQVRSVGALPVVGDSPGVTGTLKAAEKCGILAVCREEDVELAVFESVVEFPFPEGKTIKKISPQPGFDASGQGYFPCQDEDAYFHGHDRSCKKHVRLYRRHAKSPISPADTAP